MLPVEVLAAPGGNLVLRARGSELLIITSHIAELRTRKEPKDFTNYFMGEALINRPARKLFEAWLRKDKGLWRRIYDTVQTQITDADMAGGEAPAPKEKVKDEKPAQKAAKKPAAEQEVKAAKKPAAKKEEEPKPKAKPAAKKEEEPKAKAKPAAKEKAAPAKKEAPKKAAAAKKPAAKAAPAKAKSAAKKK